MRANKDIIHSVGVYLVKKLKESYEGQSFLRHLDGFILKAWEEGGRQTMESIRAIPCPDCGKKRRAKRLKEENQ